MREILFRAKRIDDGEWIEGLLCYNIYSHLSIQPTKEENCCPILMASIGQFTGLTDKNGKKIFEGDIVKRDFTLWHGEKKKTRETQIGVVFYSDTDCGFNFKNACNLRKQWDGDTLEIIGNIHDNPELFKEG